MSPSSAPTLHRGSLLRNDPHRDDIAFLIGIRSGTQQMIEEVKSSWLCLKRCESFVFPGSNPVRGSSWNFAHSQDMIIPNFCKVRHFPECPRTLVIPNQYWLQKFPVLQILRPVK